MLDTARRLRHYLEAALLDRPPTDLAEAVRAVYQSLFGFIYAVQLAFYLLEQGVVGLAIEGFGANISRMLVDGRKGG